MILLLQAITRVTSSILLSVLFVSIPPSLSQPLNSNREKNTKQVECRILGHPWTTLLDPQSPSPSAPDRDSYGSPAIPVTQPLPKISPVSCPSPSFGLFYVSREGYKVITPAVVGRPVILQESVACRKHFLPAVIPQVLALQTSPISEIIPRERVCSRTAG